MGWRGEQAVAGRAPNQAYGYYAGYGPVNGGSGSGMGQPVAGRGKFASGNGVTVAGQEWHPTILYLGALVVVELVVFGWIGHLLK